MRKRWFKEGISTRVDRGRPKRAVLWVAVAALLFVAGTYLAPILETADLPGAWLARFVYSPLCHQQPSRCFEIGQAPQAICARCAGLYWGGVAGLFAAAWIVIGKRRDPGVVLLACASAPTVIDAMFVWLGLPGLPELPRHVIAWPPGFVAGLFLAVGISDIELSFLAKQSLGGERIRSASAVEELNG